MLFRQEEDSVNETFRQEWGNDLDDRDDYPIWCYFLSQYKKRFDEGNYTSLLSEIEERFHVVRESNIRLNEKKKRRESLSDDECRNLQIELKIWNVNNLRKIVKQYFIDSLQAFENENICLFTKLIEIKNKFLYPLIQHAINPAWQLSTRGVNVECLCIHEQCIRDLFGYRDAKENGNIESQDSGDLLRDLQEITKEKERVEKGIIMRQGLVQAEPGFSRLPDHVVKMPPKKTEMKREASWKSEESKKNLKTAAFIAGGILFGTAVILAFMFGGGLPIVMGFLAIHLIHVAPLAVKLCLVVGGMLAGGGLGYGGKRVNDVVGKGKEEISEKCVSEEITIKQTSPIMPAPRQESVKVRFNAHASAASLGVFGARVLPHPTLSHNHQNTICQTPRAGEGAAS